MDPSNKSTPGFESSTPVFTENPQGELVPAAAEQAPAAPERAPVPAAPPAGPPLSAIPLPTPGPAPAAPTGSVTPALPTTPAIDDNDDRVEKVWVEKAKQIVEHTRNDPHKQSQELTVFKADYMKKRYGKSIKITQ